MEKSYLKKSNYYDNPYESYYNLLKNNNTFYKNEREFDDAWSKVQSGNNETFRDLDSYIKTLELAASNKVNQDYLKKYYDTEMFDTETMLSALYAETLANDTELKDREKIVYNEQGAPKLDEEGKYVTEKIQSSDRTYLRNLINEKLAYNREQYNLSVEQDVKNNLSFWKKTFANLATPAQEFVTGVTTQVDDFLSFLNGTGNAILSFLRHGDAKRAADVRLAGTLDPSVRLFDEFNESVIDFERRYSDIRKINGEYSNFGQYIGGVSHTLGQMIPSILVGKGIGGVGSKIASSAASGTTKALVGSSMMTAGSAASQLIFYEAMDASTIRDMYTQFAREGISVSSAHLLANADVKAALQYGVEVGLARILGGSALDNIVFGRKAGKATGDTLKISAARRLFHDFMEEGLEETFQDTSDFFVDKAFDFILKTNFNKINSLTSEDLMNSFIIGGLASLVGSAVKIATTKNIVIKTDEEYNKLSKIESWEYGINMSSILSNYNIIKDYANQARISNDQNAIKSSQAALYEMYTACRILSTVANSIGQEKFNKASQVLDYVTEAYRDGQFTAESALFYATDIKNNIEKLYTPLEYKGVIKKFIKYKEKAEKVLKIKKTVERDAKKDYTLSNDFKNKIDKIFENNKSINKVNITKYGDNVAQDGDEVYIPENFFQMDQSEAITDFCIADESIIDQVIVSIESGNIVLSKDDYKILENIYKNYKSVKKNPSRRELVASLCFDVDFVTEVLYNDNVRESIFRLITKIQKSHNTYNDNFDISYNTKLTTIANNMKDAIVKFVIENGYVSDYADYGIFTKEDFKYIEDKRYTKNLYNKIVTDYRSITDEEWSNLERLFSRVTDPDFNVKEFIQSLKQGGTSTLSINQLLKDAYTKLNKSWQGSFTGVTKTSKGYVVGDYFPNDTEANRAFNRFLVNKGLTLKDLNNPDTLTNSDIEYAKANGINEKYVSQIYCQQFEDTYSNYETSFVNNQLVSVVNSKSYKYEKVKNLTNKYTQLLLDLPSYKKKFDKDFFNNNFYEQRIFDNNTELDIVKDVINNNNDFLTNSTTIDDLVKNPSLLKEEIKKQILDKYGYLDERFVYLYLNDYVSSKYNNKINLGITNNGNTCLISPYLFTDFVKIKYDDFVKIVENAINTSKTKGKDVVIKLSDFVKDELLAGFLKDSYVKFTDKVNEDYNGYFTVYSEIPHILINSKRNTTTDVAITIAHEFQHALQYFYKLQGGSSLEYFTIRDGKINISPAVKNPEVIHKLAMKVADIAGYDKRLIDKGVHYKLLRDLLYYNTGELYANAMYDNASICKLGLPVILKSNVNGTNTISFLGETIEYATNNSKLYQFSEPIYENISEILGLDTDLDESLYNFTGINYDLKDVNLDSLDIEDRKSGAQELYKTLGGSKQFKDLNAFANAKIPVVYFEAPGSKVYNGYVIATLGKITPDILSDITQGREGKLYVSTMSVKQLYYFDKALMNNVIVKKDKVFSGDNVGVMFKVNNELKFSYDGNIVDNSTNNVTFAEEVEQPLTLEERQKEIDKEVAEQIEKETSSEETIKYLKEAEAEEDLARRKEESDKILAEFGEKRIAEKEKKYGAKVIRAEIEKGGKNDKYESKTIFYFDHSIKGGNVDYAVVSYKYPEGHTKGKNVSSKKAAQISPVLENFKGKNRSTSFMQFIKDTEDVKLPAMLQKKINEGTLTENDVFSYIRETPFDKIDDKTFELINKNFYKNNAIKSKEQLEELVNDTSKLYAAAVLFYRNRMTEWLEEDYGSDIISEITSLLEQDSGLASIVSEIQQEYNEILVSSKYLRTLYMRMFDGTLVSAFRAAKYAKLAVEQDWKTTGDVETIRSESEAQSKKGKQYTSNILEDTADVTSDEEYFGSDYQLYSTDDREKIRTIMEILKKKAIIELKEGVKTSEDFGGDFGKYLNKKLTLLKEKSFDDPEFVEKNYRKATQTEKLINQLYARAIAYEATGNDSYLYDVGTVEKVIKYFDNSQRTSRNIVQNIKHTIKTIQRNLSEAERKAFLKNNSDIFNKDLTLKEDVYKEEGKYKDFSILSELEERVKSLSSLAQSHELSDNKQTRLRKKSERLISHYESEVERLRRQNTNLKNNVKTVNVSDVEILVDSSVEIPNSFVKLLSTEFDRSAKDQVKFTDTEDKTHAVTEISKFIDQNAEYLRNMTSSEANDIVDFLLKSTLVPSTNKLRTYIAVEICMITYILKDAKLSNPQFNIPKEKLQQLDDKFETFQSVFGQGLATIRSATALINPTKIVLDKLSKQFNLEISDEDMDNLSNAVRSGNYVDIQQAQQQIYDNLSKTYKGRKISLFNRLLRFSRTAMLSSPGTWIRNYVSNFTVTYANKLASKIGSIVQDKVLSKLFKNQPVQKNAYVNLDKIKISEKAKDFIQREVIDSKLIELIQDGVSKYDITAAKGRTTDAIIAKMIANSIRNKFTYNEGVTNKYLDKWYKFIFDRISDDKFVNKAFIGYLGKTLTYDKVDLNSGVTNTVMKHIADAYVLALDDYMHKSNFINSVENVMRQKLGPAGFFVYKSIFPFLSASVNWFVEGLKYTPVGLANSIVKFAKMETYIANLDKKNSLGEGVSSRFGNYLVTRDIGKGVLGTIGFAIGAMLAGFGRARIDDEDDKVKLVVGDTYIDITSLFGTQGITTGMALVSAIKHDESSSFTSVLKNTLDQMFMDTTISNMYNTIRYSTSAGEFLMSIPFNMASNFVPNIISAVVSPTNIYKTKYERGLVGKLETLLLKALPSFSYALPKAVDPYTGKYKVAYKVPVLTKYWNKLTPIDIYPYDISKTEKIAISLGIKSNGLKGKYKVDDDVIKFSNKVTEKLNVMFGKLNERELNDFINNKKSYKVLDKNNKYVTIKYSSMTDSQRKNVIERIKSENAEIVKIYALTTSNKYKYYASDNEKYQALKKLGISKNLYISTGTDKGFVKIK